jgi:succinyl-CoA synthetase beta subunit
VILVSKEGGIDIEETSRSGHEKIFKIHINTLTGLHDYQARRLAVFMDREHSSTIADIIKKLYRIFIDNDCLLAEINPLAITHEGIFALDARIVIDDNARFRHYLVEEETGSLEVLAGKNGMSYVDLDGNIGCIVNGAGLAMSTLDMIQIYGGSPANFMDVRAGANEEQMKTALKIITSNRRVSTIIVNIFGGLTKCDEVARAIIDMSPEINKPLVIRLAGTNEKEGRMILEKHGITMAGSTEEAAKAVVELEHSHR